MFIYQSLTILLIFSLPFFKEQFVSAHVKSLIVVFCVLLLPIFFRALIDDIKREFTPTIVFIAFLISMTASTIYSIKLQESSMQLLLFFSYFIIFVSIRSVFPTLRSREFFACCFLFIVSCLSIISLYNTLIRHYVSREHLSFLWVYFGHNHLSALLVFAIPLSLYFLKTYWQKKQIRILLLVTCFLLLVSLLFTFSIGAMISLAIAFLIAFKKFPFRKVYFIVFLIIAFLGISSLYLFSQTKGSKILDLQKNPATHMSARFIYWRAAYDNFLKNPLTGSGLETFNEALAKFARTKGLQNVHYTTHAHNFFIQMLTDAGIFGFLTSIVLISSVLWKAAKKALENVSRSEILLRRRNFFYISLFIGLLSSTFLSVIDLEWHAPVVFLFFWIFAGLLRKYAK